MSAGEYEPFPGQQGWEFFRNIMAPPSGDDQLARAFNLATQQGSRVKSITTYPGRVVVEYFESEEKDIRDPFIELIKAQRWRQLDRDLQELNPMRHVIHISRKLWEAMPENRIWTATTVCPEEVLYHGFRMKISDDPKLESFRVEEVQEEPPATACLRHRGLDDSYFHPVIKQGI